MKTAMQQGARAADNMRIVILGSTGMAGHVIALYLQEQGYCVYRASRSEQNTSMSAAIDITDFGALSMWLDNVSPNVIINCIGLLQKDCDLRPDLAVLINAYLPHWLEKKYMQTATRVIHLSTDCVFSGKKGGYTEDDLADGSSVYDRSKALGELNNEKDLTFRMSIIGPDIDPNGTGLFNWFMYQHGEVQGWRRALWNGITTVELARGIGEAIQQGITGLYQLVSKESIEKYYLLKMFKTHFERDDIAIVPIDGIEINKTLVSTRTDFLFEVKPYDDQISEMKAWVDEHLTLYEHYER